MISGLLGGSTGLAGIPIIVWATLRGWSRDEQRAIFQPVAVAIFLMTLGWFGARDMITADTVRLFLIGLPAVLLGTWLGFKLYGKLDDAAFQKIVLVLLLVSGLTLLPSVFWVATSGAKSMPHVTRRELLGGLGAASATPLCPSLAFAGSRTSHTFKLDEFEIAILSDGHLMIPTQFLARNVSEEEIKAWLGQSGGMVTPASNVTLVRTPSDLILIDVGAGPHFMPTAGKLADNMEAVGIDRQAITKVVFTHAHPDHLWGTFDDFDEPMCPNASYFIPAAEWNFWTADDVISRLPEDRQNFAPGAQRTLSRIRERLRTINPGEDIVTGVRAIDTSGHTPGHISIEIVSGDDVLIVLADALTHATISFAHPEWKPAGDHYDAERATATRMALLDRLATDRTRLIGYHLPFPGLGHAERSGTEYRYIPIA